MKKGSKFLWRVLAVLLGVSLIGIPVGAKEKDSYCTIVRESPHEEGRRIGTMAEGTAVRILGQKGQFYKIDCYDMVGYVSKGQVKDGVIRCDPNSGETEILVYTSAGKALQLRHSLLTLAKRQLGEPYIYGSSGPWGFDCSGLTSYLYANHDIDISRRASLQMGDGIIVARAGLQVGDLLFFKEPGEGELTSHVGIYAGDNRMIHAGSEGVCLVTLTGDYFDGNFQCARRIVNTKMPQTGKIFAGFLEFQ